MSIKNIYLLPLALIITIFYSCDDSNSFDDVPEISFIGWSKDTVAQNQFSAGDSVILVFHYQDGDNNLGSDDSINCFLIDNRFDSRPVDPYRIPMIRNRGDDAVEGEIYITWRSCCTYPNNVPANCQNSTRFPYNDVTLDIYVEDNSGNRSNTITTTPVTLICDANLVRN